jgi:hypothetical protein
MMDTMQATYGLSLPALDPFGGPHFTTDDDGPVDSKLAWIGDPSSVPLPYAGDPEQGFDASDELDGIIFAALLTP